MAQSVMPMPRHAERIVGGALLALEEALRAADGFITPATETRIENALHVMRCCDRESEAFRRLEAVAPRLRLMAEAKRTHRPNFYASQLLRLRREFFV